VAMTQKERVYAQIRHLETDPVPYTLRWYEEDVAERLDDHYGSRVWRSWIDSAIRHVPGPQLVPDDTSGAIYTDIYGSTWRVDLKPWHMTDPAIKAPSLKGFDFPDVNTLFEPGWEEEAMQYIQQHQDHFLVIGLGFGPFERSWALRGFEEVMADVALNTDFYGELIEQIVDHQLAILDRLLTLPVDGIMFSDDWGYQKGVLIGAERWRRIIKPHLARLYDRAHKADKLALNHCCGSIVDIMPDLIEIGLDVLESVQPEATGMNPYDLKRQFGANLTFWGGLGSQSTIPFGTPETIRSEVAKLRHEMGKGGGYILSPAKALMVDTPAVNAAALVEAFVQR
jgi:uroporphyrinogen decarboxylase